MITFPCCKINLGLNVVAKRNDGYHDIETVFFPVPLTDALEIKKMDEDFPSAVDCDLKVTGDTAGNDSGMEESNNLVVKAYNLLAKDFQLPRIHAHLCKRIPTQAGLGGGSADAAYMIRLLDERFRLNMGIAEMERYAAMLGADCAFFVTAEPAFATGKGEILEPVAHLTETLDGFYLALVKPNVSVSTAQAYAAITPQRPDISCRDIVSQPVENWREQLRNDFEIPVFDRHPILAHIKQQLYELGAAYAQMSGSGSTVYGLFRQRPADLQQTFPESFTAVCPL